MASITNTIAAVGVAIASLLNQSEIEVSNNSAMDINNEFNTEYNFIMDAFSDYNNEFDIVLEDISDYDGGIDFVLDNISVFDGENIIVTDEVSENNNETTSDVNSFKVPAVATSRDSTMPYYVKVNITQNVINIYKKDASGDYTIPEKAILCSTGTATPKAGSKHIITSYRSRWNKMRGGVYAQYAVQVVGNILFHSVPYLKKNNTTLEYWEYDKLGTKASMGCIRMSTADAKWFFENVWAGTTVEFYKDEDPGPFGKPEGIKISQDKAKRGWDPTDYVEGNPWHAEN